MHKQAAAGNDDDNDYGGGDGEIMVDTDNGDAH